jgi:hypothetical protein
MSMLINAGADVNQADNDGNCAAHWAARSGRVDNLKFLLEHGAQFNQRNNAGKTVFGVAAAARTAPAKRCDGCWTRAPTLVRSTLRRRMVPIRRLYCCCARWVSI